MLESRRKLLNAALLWNLMVSIFLLVTTVILFHSIIVGSLGLATSSICIAYAILAILVLNKSPSAFSVGVLVGSSFVILSLSLLGVLYWTCLADSDIIRDHSYARIIACICHMIIFIVQLVITSIIVYAKEDIIDTCAAYEYVPDAPYSNFMSYGSISASSPINYSKAPTADI